LDKGAHGLQTISGHGFIMNHRNLTLSRLSEEHGIIDLPDSTKHNLSLGDKIFVIPNHSCAAANFYKEYLVDCGDGNFETWELLGKR
jgi:D-serine deaminase-like pyridoxal phosphate-dependent protein